MERRKRSSAAAARGIKRFLLFCLDRRGPAAHSNVTARWHLVLSLPAIRHSRAPPYTRRRACTRRLPRPPTAVLRPRLRLRATVAGWMIHGPAGRGGKEGARAAAAVSTPLRPFPHTRPSDAFCCDRSRAHGWRQPVLQLLRGLQRVHGQGGRPSGVRRRTLTNARSRPAPVPASARSR
jgi:hypothetical protein